ncbi:SPASM domain-containing protein, partial [bacterium]|nr:SPASM domain-containing protein [bacterium]
KKRRDTTFHVLKQTVRFILRESRSEESIQFLLFGGEPLLVFDTIVDFVPYARREFMRAGKKASFSITTNGSLITPEMMQFFRGYNVNLLLSMDGGRESHNTHRKFPDGTGTFDTIASRIPMMKYFQPWLGARVTPTPETVGRLADDVMELVDLGINQFIIGCATGIEWPKAGYRVFIEQMKRVLDNYVALKKKKHPIRISLLENWGTLDESDMTHVWGCSAGRYRISVDVDGKIQACAKGQGAFDGEGFLPLGDVVNGFSKERLDNRLEYYRISSVERKKCVKCKAQKSCTGGCPATNYVATGSVAKCPASDCYLQRLYLDLRKYYLSIMARAGLSLVEKTA